MNDHTEVTLERFKYCILQDLSKELAEDFAISPKVDLSLHQDFDLDYLAMRLRQDIFGKQIEKITIKYPKDWREAVKARWFPDWAKRKWPVVEKVHMIDIKALYPSIPEIPGHPYRLHVHHGQSHHYNRGKGHDTPPWQPPGPLDTDWDLTNLQA